MHNHWS